MVVRMKCCETDGCGRTRALDPNQACYKGLSTAQGIRALGSQLTLPVSELRRGEEREKRRGGVKAAQQAVWKGLVSPGSRSNDQQLASSLNTG